MSRIIALSVPLSYFEGSSENDILIGGGGTHDYIFGNAGDDTLMGLRFRDQIFGGDGNDILNGGKGIDNLLGGLGNDILIGGRGKDKFILGRGFGMDTILDFTNSEDMVSLMNGLTFEQLLIVPAIYGTLITKADSGEILATLIGVSPNVIGSEDFINVTLERKFSGNSLRW
jgi:Ca2+-binding RTX toxin-like protein